VLILPSVPVITIAVTADKKPALRTPLILIEVGLFCGVFGLLFYLGEIAPHQGLIDHSSLQHAGPGFANAWNIAGYLLAASGLAVSFFLWRSTSQVRSWLLKVGAISNVCYSLAIPITMKLLLSAVLDAFLL
jgi:hypothetical protein